jgi:hypothetical protein
MVETSHPKSLVFVIVSIIPYRVSSPIATQRISSVQCYGATAMGDTVTHPSGNLGLHDAAHQVDDDVSIRWHIYIVNGLDPGIVALLQRKQAQEVSGVQYDHSLYYEMYT